MISPLNADKIVITLSGRVVFPMTSFILSWPNRLLFPPARMIYPISKSILAFMSEEIMRYWTTVSTENIVAMIFNPFQSMG
jgi:hypothetical protein